MTPRYPLRHHADSRTLPGVEVLRRRIGRAAGARAVRQLCGAVAALVSLPAGAGDFLGTAGLPGTSRFLEASARPVATVVAAQPGASVAVDAVIDRAARFIARRQLPPQSPDATLVGSFAAESNPTAVTAAAVLALLSAGHTEDDGRYGLILLRAADFLLTRPLTEADAAHAGSASSAVLALRVLALAELSVQTFDADRRKNYTAALNEAARKLLDLQDRSDVPERRGGWSEDSAAPPGLTPTAWSCLALHVAGQAGFLVPDEALRLAAEFARRCRADQPAAAPFTERPGSKSLPTSTAAGLLITRLSPHPDLTERERQAVAHVTRNPLTSNDPAVYQTTWLTLLALHRSDPVAAASVRRWALPLVLSLVQDDGGFAAARDTLDSGRTYATALALLTLTAERPVLLAHTP